MGMVFDPAIRAAATMILALPKTRLLARGGEAQVGELYLPISAFRPGCMPSQSWDSKLALCLRRVISAGCSKIRVRGWAEIAC